MNYVITYAERGGGNGNVNAIFYDVGGGGAFLRLTKLIT